MDSQSKILFTALIGVGLLVLGIFLQPTIEEGLAPALKTAWVGIEISGSGIAEVGPVELETGVPFTLHAIVEAQGPVFYTEAPAIRLHGEEIEPSRVRSWKRPLEPRIRWFTIEGSPPYVELASIEDFDRVGFQEIYRPDWPLLWSVAGNVEPAKDDHLHEDTTLARRDFGVQRYHVAVELYDKIDKLRPKKRVRSWSTAQVRSEAERFPTVRRVLPGRLAPASRVFGLTQLEVSRSEASSELLPKIDEATRQDLAFSRATVLRDQIRGAGKRLEDLTWSDVDLVEGGSFWGEAAEPGDLLRVGERVVVLYEDRGKPGVLDYEDLCFDYVRGAEVRRLGDVFTGDGVVELASLGS